MNALTNIGPARSDRLSHQFYATIASERDALEEFLLRPPQADVEKIVALLARQSRPIVFTGMGKSGQIASKIAATFSSLDIAAISVNAAEAAHGDLGAVQSGSVVVMLSNSGCTEEIVRLVPSLKARRCTLVGILGRKTSPLSRSADYLIVAVTETEAEPLGLAPTSSTALQLAIGDGLAVAVSRTRGLTREDFLKNHPAGPLGRQMVPVVSLMRQGEDLPTVRKETSLLELLTVMSSKRMGAACVVSEDGKLCGLVVDGDVRRHLQQTKRLIEATAGDIMEENPRTVGENARLGDIVAADNSWLVMPVVDAAGSLQGMLHIQDILG
jgi:arabinose-5-phosphate isomerase